MKTHSHFFCSFCSEANKQGREDQECTGYHSKTYKRGEYIALQGSPVLHLYMLSKGKVRTEMVSDSGLTIHIEDISAPYPLAAAFIFADHHYFPVDVVALEDSEVLMISKDSVEKQMARCPGFLHGFLAFNANRIQFLSDRLKVFSQRGIKAKIAYYILQRVKQDYFDFDRSITSLADYFGVERPSLSRAISEMTKNGIIEFENGSGKILDYNKIKEIIG